MLAVVERGESLPPGQERGVGGRVAEAEAEGVVMRGGGGGGEGGMSLREGDGSTGL